MIQENLFLIIIGLIWIVIAVVQDFRKREVANWWNFSLVGIALSYRAFASVWINDYWYFLWGLIGYLIFIILGYAFYYARVFAGGDAKLLMGLGAILPLSNQPTTNLTISICFIILFLICGSVYGLLYSLVLALKNSKKFSKEFKKQRLNHKKTFIIFTTLSALTVITVLIIQELILLWTSLIIFSFPFLISYAKAIEESCLIVEKKPKQLTLGDWLYKTVKIGNKKIKPNWEGLSEKELKLLKKYRGKVLIKEGIPFTPAFLFAYIVLIYVIKEGILDWIYQII